MVPGIARLRAAREFEAVLSQGKSLRRGRVIVRTRGNDVGHARLGIIASRKALQRAVDRNRCKRMLREAFRAAAGRLPPVDIVVQLRESAARGGAFTWGEAKAIFGALIEQPRTGRADF